MNKNALILFFISLIVFSCKRQLYQFNIFEKKKLNVDEITFEYFQGKSKIRFSDDKQSVNATSNIRIKSDSIIWISIAPAMGIEFLRTIITQDSIYLIDRLNKEFTVLDFDSLSRRVNFNLSYRTIESLFIGNLLFVHSGNDKFYKDGDFYILTQNDGKLTIENFINAVTMKVEKIDVTEAGSENQLNLTFLNFQEIDSMIFPFENTIRLSYRDQNRIIHTQIDNSYIKATFSDKKIKFPFNIPNRYEARDN